MKRIATPFFLSVAAVIVALLMADAPLRAQNVNPGAVAPAASFVYVVNTGSNDISVYEIETSSGSLVPIAGSPFPTTESPLSPVILTTDSANKFAYLLNTGETSAVSTYGVDLQTGLLTLVSSTTYPASLGSMALTPKARYIYLGSSDRLGGYKVDKQTGVPSGVARNTIVTGQELSQGAIDPYGRFLYIGNTLSGSVLAFAINGGNGTITAIPGSPFAAGNSPARLAVEPCGRFLYVTNEGSNDVSAYVIDQKTGALTPVPGSPFTAETFPLGITVDSRGRFVFVANEYSNSVSVYQINRPTGSLVQVSGSPFSSGLAPVTVAVAPNGKFVYAANFDVLPTEYSTVSGYSLDPETGALAPVPGSPFTTDQNPYSIAITGQPVGCVDR